MTEPCPQIRQCAEVIHQFADWANEHGDRQIAEYRALNEKIDGLGEKLDKIGEVVLGNGDVQKSLVHRVAQLEATEQGDVRHGDRVWKIIACVIAGMALIVAIAR